MVSTCPPLGFTPRVNTPSFHAKNGDWPPFPVEGDCDCALEIGPGTSKYKEIMITYGDRSKLKPDKGPQIVEYSSLVLTICIGVSNFDLYDD